MLIHSLSLFFPWLIDLMISQRWWAEAELKAISSSQPSTQFPGNTLCFISSCLVYGVIFCSEALNYHQKQPTDQCDFFFQGRCTRENCKYLHPPTHLKTQLEINGRNNLIQQKTAAAMLAQQMQFMFPGTPLQPVVSVFL